MRPNKSPEPTAVGAVSSAVASVKPRGATPLYGVHVASRRWLSFFVRCLMSAQPDLSDTCGFLTESVGLSLEAGRREGPVFIAGAP